MHWIPGSGSDVESENFARGRVQPRAASFENVADRSEIPSFVDRQIAARPHRFRSVIVIVLVLVLGL